MSWNRAGQLISGPPTLSGGENSSNASGSGGLVGGRLVDRLKPNLGGLNAFQRERQIVGRYGDYGQGGSEREGKGKGKGKTEWDVLRENHRFIRDDEAAGEVSWEERLARAYESKLFKEFALIDLKHYKSKRFALRWRTAPEVVEGIGEDTCGSLRCKHHRPATNTDYDYANDIDPEDGDYHSRYRGRERHSYDERGHRRRKTNVKPPPSLRAFELPFVYQEAGQRKEALVKVRLCRRCEGKLRWKPPEEREGARTRTDINDGGEESEDAVSDSGSDRVGLDEGRKVGRGGRDDSHRSRESSQRWDRVDRDIDGEREDRSRKSRRGISRSRSPSRRKSTNER